MARNTSISDPALSDYVARVGATESPARAALREETAGLEMAMMQISALQAAFLQSLVRFGGVQRYLEIGTFTGYSALAVAEAMQGQGRIVTCDISEEWTAIGRRHWRAAGVDPQIDLRLAPALETLEALEAERARFDMAFIDADKVSYEAYYEACLRLVRPGGLIAVDNVIWGGSVLDPDPESEATRAIQAFNEARVTDERVHRCLVPIGDGVSLLSVRA